MRAVGVTEWGGPEQLQVLDVTEPHAAPGEVRIAVRAASVVAADALFRAGALAARVSTPAPWVPGTEVAGVIDEAPGSGPWQVGDEVLAIVVPWAQNRGASAERVVVPAGSVAALPASTDFAGASTLPMSGLTASALLDLIGLSAGQTLAVTGAGGVVGGFISQLATSAGITVVTDAPGSDGAIDRNADYAQQIRGRFPNGVDALVDAAVLGEALLPAVKDGGTYACLRAAEFDTGRDIAKVGVSVWDYALDGARLAGLASLVGTGELTLPAVRTYSPEQASEAHEALAVRGRGARGVIVF